MSLDERSTSSTPAAVDAVDAVASPERAVTVIGELVGPTLAFGPVPVGPADMAVATAAGRTGALTARRVASRRVEVTVPAHLDVTIAIGRRTVPVDVDLVVRVGLTARPVEEEGVVDVDVAPIGAGAIDVDARTSGVGGVMVRRMADLEGEIRSHVGVYVSTLLATPAAVAACRLPLDGD